MLQPEEIYFQRGTICCLLFPNKTSASQKLALPPGFYFQASQFCLDLDKILCLQSSANVAIKKVSFFNVCILDSFSGRFPQRYAKLLHKLFKRSEFIQTTEYFGEERADLPRKRPFALQKGRQCSAALWPADGGWSSGKNFAGRSRHSHRRPWESPASPTHLATESTR